ncbi:MAG TPA: hypothetical protein VHH34_14435 [Pseudonocardiaceae bacterium]|nr:hypothetical protein [Pseudonocardiaceae bacterium]
MTAYAETRRIRDICRATVKVCESAGVLDVAGAGEMFAVAGLGPTGGPDAGY